MLASVVVGAGNSTYYRIAVTIEGDAYEFVLVALDHGATDLDPLVSAAKAGLAGASGVLTVGAFRETGSTATIS
jgi:hypothetical protein